jgi:hypothetical protein
MSYSNLNTYRNNTFRLSNENLFLIEILNIMYNDNYRQINLMTNTLNGLIETNNSIRNLLVQLLNSNQNANNTRRNNPRRWENNLYTTFTRFSAHPSNFNLNNTQRNNRNQIDTDGLFNQLFNNFLQPVEIYPTPSQIETATRNVRYCDISRPINNSCPISMENFEDNDMVTVIRNCGHIFHTEHLMNWFRSNCRCPVCRYDIRDYNPNVSNQFFRNSQDPIDSSNNVVERNNDRNINLPQNTIEIINDYYNMIPNNTFDDFLDPSGNQVGGFISLLLESMNRSRNTR